MSGQTEYPGLDYGHGKANVSASGYRFGVIGQNSAELSNEAVADIFGGRNLSFEQYQADVKEKLRSALSDYFFDSKFGDRKQSQLDTAVENAFDGISDELNDNYQGDGDRYLYEKDGYRIENTETELTILESPFFTHAQFCSPCFPGAGNLDSPCPDGPKTFCLGHDWFEDSKAPYPVFSVATGELIGGDK